MELINFPESNRESLGSPESTASQLKPMDTSSSRMLKKNDEESENLHEHETPNNFDKETAQVKCLDIINAEVMLNKFPYIPAKDHLSNKYLSFI